MCNSYKVTNTSQDISKYFPDPQTILKCKIINFCTERIKIPKKYSTIDYRCIHKIVSPIDYTYRWTPYRESFPGFESHVWMDRVGFWILTFPMSVFDNYVSQENRNNPGHGISHEYPSVPVYHLHLLFSV